jgi:hypothetical protein
VGPAGIAAVDVLEARIGAEEARSSASAASKSDTALLPEIPADCYASGIMDQGPLEKASIPIAADPSSQRIALVFVAFAASLSLIPQSIP